MREGVEQAFTSADVQNAGGKRRRRCFRESAFAASTEAAQCYADGEGDVGHWTWGVELRLVSRDSVAIRTVDGELRPGLSMAPRGRARILEFCRRLTMRLVDSKRLLEAADDRVRVSDGKKRDAI